MLAKLIVAAMFTFCVCSLNAQPLTKFSDVVDTNVYVAFYESVSGSGLYNGAFIYFPRATNVESRNIIPPTNQVNTGASTKIHLDSCLFKMVYASPADQNGSHSYLSEFRNPSDGKTIAIEYGAPFILKSENIKTLSDGSQLVGANYSYFIDLFLQDNYASQYSRGEIRDNVAFRNENGNVLIEHKYKNEVVGITYYCANNQTTYTRYFRAKQ
jgi:hypothetical protein